MKNVAVLTEDGPFALFFRSHPGGFDSSIVPTPGNLLSNYPREKKSNARGSAGGGGNWTNRWTEIKLKIEAKITFCFFCAGITNLLFDGLAYNNILLITHNSFYATRKISRRIIC